MAIKVGARAARRLFDEREFEIHCRRTGVDDFQLHLKGLSWRQTRVGIHTGGQVFTRAETTLRQQGVVEIVEAETQVGEGLCVTGVVSDRQRHEQDAWNLWMGVYISRQDMQLRSVPEQRQPASSVAA